MPVSRILIVSTSSSSQASRRRSMPGSRAVPQLRNGCRLLCDSLEQGLPVAQARPTNPSAQLQQPPL